MKYRFLSTSKRWRQGSASEPARLQTRFLTLAICAFAAIGSRAAPQWDAPPEQQTEGGFWRWHWYQRGLTNANPGYDSRFRVNSPEVSLHPVFGRRTEARENGLMQIRGDEDLFQLTAAEFYAEVWAAIRAQPTSV